MAVRDGQHLNDGRKLSINYCKWKSPQKELSRAVSRSGPTLRSLSNAGDRAAHLTCKSGSRARASLPIPAKGSLELLTRCFVELNFLVCHEGAWRRFARELPPRKPSLPFQSPDPQCAARSLAPRPFPRPPRLLRPVCESASARNLRVRPRTR